MTVEYKDGVSSVRLQPIMMLAISRIEKIFHEFNLKLVITSTDDGFHSTDSLHYLGLALDIRITPIPSDVLLDVFKAIMDELASLNKKFQIVMEQDHMHVEFDRRLNS